MTNFPAQRVALEATAQLFTDSKCLVRATDIQINGVPVPQSIIRPTLGLWPMFTSAATVLYYRTPSGINSFTPATDVTTSRSVTGSKASGAAFTSLVAQLVAMGLPLVDNTSA